MKILILVSWSLLITTILFFMKNASPNYSTDTNYRKLLNFTDMEDFRILFLTQCPNTLSNLNLKKASILINYLDYNKDAVDRYQIFYGNSDELTKSMKEFISSLTKSDEGDDQSDQILLLMKYFLGIIVPFVVMILFSLFYWIFACSYCSYNYCPICIERKESYSKIEKILPALMLIFTSFSLTVTTANGMVQIPQIFSTMTDFYCQFSLHYYVLKTGTLPNITLNNQKDYIWIGLDNLNDTIISFTQNFDKFSKIDSTNLLEYIDYNKEYENHIKMFEDFYTILNNSLENLDSSIKVKPYYDKFYGDITDRELKNYEGNGMWTQIYQSYYYNFKVVFELGERINNLQKNITSNFKSLNTTLNMMLEKLNYLDTFQKTTRSILDLFHNILTGSVYNLISAVLYLVFVFQLFVSIMNILSSVLILFDNFSSFGKYLGHSGWCISSFNVLFLSILILVIYLFGFAVLLIGNVFKIYQNPSNTINTPETFFFQCFQEYNMTLFQNNFVKNDSDDQNILNYYNNYTNNLFLFSYGRKFNTLSNIYLYLKFQQFFNEVQEPYMAIRILNQDNTVYMPQIDLNQELNRFTDYRDVNPVQIFNSCKGPPTFFQFFFKASNCTYPVSDLISIDDVRGNKYCFLLNKLSLKNMSDLFEGYLDDCDSIYNDGIYKSKSMKEQLLAQHQILLNYYNEYRIYRNQIIDNIILKGIELYKNMSILTQKYYDSVDEFYVRKVVEIIKIPIDNLVIQPNLGNYFPFRFYDEYNMGNRTKLPSFDLLRYFSCSYFYDMSNRIINIMYGDIVTNMYIMLIILIFNYIYNFANSVIGLRTILINYRESLDKDDNNAVNN